MILSDVSAVRFLIQFAVVLSFFKFSNKLFDAILNISENWCTEDLGSSRFFLCNLAGPLPGVDAGAVRELSFHLSAFLCMSLKGLA